MSSSHNLHVCRYLASGKQAELAASVDAISALERDVCDVTKRMEDCSKQQQILRQDLEQQKVSIRLAVQTPPSSKR